MYTPVQKNPDISALYLQYNLMSLQKQNKNFGSIYIYMAFHYHHNSWSLIPLNQAGIQIHSIYTIMACMAYFRYQYMACGHAETTQIKQL